MYHYKHMQQTVKQLLKLASRPAGVRPSLSTDANSCEEDCINTCSAGLKFPVRLSVAEPPQKRLMQ